jgi:hypothetical protein
MRGISRKPKLRFERVLDELEIAIRGRLGRHERGCAPDVQARQPAIPAEANSATVSNFSQLTVQGEGGKYFQPVHREAMLVGTQAKL